MPVLYCLNIAAFFLVVLIGPVYLTRRFKLGGLNLLTIPLFSLLPLSFTTGFSGPFFFLEGGWFNPYFQYALLVNNVHELFTALALVFVVSRLHRSAAFQARVARITAAGGPARPERMRTAALVFLGLYLASFVLLAQHSFSVAQWVADPRTGYQLHRTGAGQWFAFCITFLSVSLVLATVYARSAPQILWMAPGYLFLTYLLGSKGLIVSAALYVVIILTLRRYRYLNVVGLVILGGAGGLVFYNFFTTFGEVGLDQISQYSDYFVNAAHYYERYLNGTLPLFNGDIFLSSFWATVPRSLFPDKPYVYGTIKVSEIFFPGASEAKATPAFATVDYFADFGWPGVIGSALFSSSNLFLAVLYAVILPRLGTFNPENRRTHGRVLLYLFLLLVAPSFLLFFEVPLNFLVAAFVIATIEIANRLRVARGPAGAGAPAPI